MTNFIRLKPWLEPLPVDDGKAIVLSDLINFILKGELLVAVLPLLDGTRSEDDITDELSEQFSLSEVYYQLIQMKEKGLIETVPDQEPTPEKILLDRMNGDPDRLDLPRRVMVTALGGLDPTPVAEKLSRLDFFQVDIADRQSAASDSVFLRVVLTPDYLEPELAEFNAEALKAGTRWLPVKPDGLEPWFGPLIDPGETACMECLLHRLRGHHVPERQRADEKGEPLRLSQGRTDASLDAVCGLLGLELEKVVSGSPHSFIDKGVVSMNIKTMETRRHELVRRPHCPACGESIESELKGLPESEFALFPQPKADYNDGGERIKAAAETMKLFETRISPITGEIGALDIQKDIPEFFGRAVNSSWATLNGHKADSSKGRLDAVGASAGKGRSEIQARTSAVGEALERYCSQYFGYEPCLKASYAEISDKAVHPLRLNHYSESQYENREEWAERGRTGRVPERFDDADHIDWTPAWSLTKGRWKFVPSACMYYHYPKDGGRFIYGDSNGVAAGNCVEEAIMQGFFELVERDSVALWWYNMLERPALDLPTYGSAFAMKAAEGCRRYGYNLHVLDLTSDLGIPVFVSVALHESDPNAEPHMGFGSHFDARIALDRAVSETGQSWTFAPHMKPNELYCRITGRNLASEQFLRPPKDAPLLPLNAFTNHAAADFLTDVRRCVSILDDLGHEMLVADLTRPEVGLTVVRVMVPGLVHFWPRFGAERLYETPVKLGWLDAPTDEADLNPVPFYA